MRLLVYIAGPYRAKTPFAVEGNIRAARELGAVVVACGHYPVIPHSNTSHFDGLGPDELFLEGTMLLMERCDAVLFAPTWQRSDGAIDENVRAKELRIPIIYGPDESYTDVARHEEIRGRLLSIVQAKHAAYARGLRDTESFLEHRADPTKNLDPVERFLRDAFNDGNRPSIGPNPARDGIAQAFFQSTCLHPAHHDEHLGEDYFIRRCTVCKKELARF